MDRNSSGFYYFHETGDATKVFTELPVIFSDPQAQCTVAEQK